MNIPLVFLYKFRKKEIQLKPQGEPREHHLGEVLQGRSKFKFNITLSYLIVLFFFSSGFHSQSYLEIKEYLISKFL